MKCTNCGVANPEGMRFCGNCGKILTPSPVEPMEARNRYCVKCGRIIGWDANACMYCGHDYRVKAKPGTEGYLLTGAVLTIVAGILSIALLTIIVDRFHDMSTGDMALATISYTCSAIGVVGGIAALMRRMFPIAVLGGACAIFTPAFYFAIPGLVLIARSATGFKEFEVKQ